MATTYELAGVKKPDHVYFNSIMPIVKNRKSRGYPDIYGGYMDLQRMVRTDRYKLIVYPKAPKVLLFDLKKDPHEISDVSEQASYKIVLQDMKDRLIRQQAKLKDTLDLANALKL